MTRMQDSKNSKQDPIVSLLVSVVSTVTCGYFFPTWELGVIVGLIIGLHVYAVTQCNTFSKKRKEDEENIQDSLSRLSELLRISEKYYDTEWLYAYLKDIVSVHEDSKDHPVFLALTKGKLGDGLERAKGVIGGEQINYARCEERERQRRLKEFVLGSRKYVKAVTSYDPIYWNEFWLNPRFSKGYTDANIEVAANDIEIDRIFILPNDVLNGNNKELCNEIKKIVNPMRDKKNLGVHFVSSEDLPETLISYRDENFFISDDLFIGYLKNYADEKEAKGHVTINNRTEVRKMLNKFEDLLDVSKPAKEYTFLG